MINSVLVKIYNFGAYAPGWCYGEGEAYTKPTIESASFMAMELLRNGFSMLDAFPGLAGEIRVTAYFGEHYLEFTLERDGLATFLHETGNTENEYAEGLSIYECVQKIKQYRFLCGLSELFIPPTMTGRENDFKALPSTHPVTEASPCFAYAAPWKPAERLVSTYTIITKKSAETPQFFGFSTSPYCLMAH